MVGNEGNVTCDDGSDTLLERRDPVLDHRGTRQRVEALVWGSRHGRRTADRHERSVRPESPQSRALIKLVTMGFACRYPFEHVSGRLEFQIEHLVGDISLQINRVR